MEKEDVTPVEAAAALQRAVVTYGLGRMYRAVEVLVDVMNRCPCLEALDIDETLGWDWSALLVEGISWSTALRGLRTLSWTGENYFCQLDTGTTFVWSIVRLFRSMDALKDLVLNIPWFPSKFTWPVNYVDDAPTFRLESFSMHDNDNVIPDSVVEVLLNTSAQSLRSLKTTPLQSSHLHHFPSLTTLEIYHNNSSFPLSETELLFKNCPNLRHLSLHWFPLSGANMVLNSLPPTLRVLELSYGEFSARNLLDKLVLPHWLPELAAIWQMDRTGNFLPGTWNQLEKESFTAVCKKRGISWG